MILEEHFNVPEEVSYVTNGLRKAGFEAYLVGGCVRDLKLGKTPKDWDVTTNAHPDKIQELFEETFYTNDFGTVGVVTGTTSDESVKVIEVTPYRTESTYSDARRPDSVEFSKTLEEDLKRRDLTINAFAYDDQSNILVDSYDGISDLKNSRIRAVGDPNARFQEDALRMLRAIRLAAELGFTIEQNTFEAIAKNSNLLEKISKERIRDEFTRIVLSSRPMEAVLHMKHLDMLESIVPELLLTDGVEQNRSHIYTVFEHLLRSLQHAADKDYALDVRLAALFHDIAKPETKRYSEDIKEYTFYGHEVVGSRVTKKILSNLKYPSKTIEKVTLLVRWHMFFADPDQITLSAVRRIIRNVGKENIYDLLNLRICDRIGMGRPKEQPFRYRKYKAMVEQALRDPISVAMLKINGNDIQMLSHETPGPYIGYILHALLEEVLDDPTKNTSEYLKRRASELEKLSQDKLRALGASGKERQEKEETAEIRKIQKRHAV